jgi:ABC-type dipeptide/oligopeptide/nickel transport system permease subunit
MKRAGKLSLAILLIIALLSIFAPVLRTYDPDRIDLNSLKEPPSLQHLFGTDNKGRDIFSRILYGGRISIGISLTAGCLSMGIGLLIGICSGYFGGKVDTLLMAFVDLILSFPSLLLAIGISIVLPPGIFTVTIAIIAVGWGSFARLVRGQILTLRESQYVDAARAIGCSNLRILFLHLMPQCIPILLVMTSLKIGGYLITEASLSFLGLGAQPPTATWGSMINANRVYLSSAPWTIIFPGCVIAITAFCFNILGDALRDKYGFKIRE